MFIRAFFSGVWLLVAGALVAAAVEEPAGEFPARSGSLAAVMALAEQDRPRELPRRPVAAPRGLAAVQELAGAARADEEPAAARDWGQAQILEPRRAVGSPANRRRAAERDLAARRVPFPADRGFVPTGHGPLPAHVVDPRFHHPFGFRSTVFAPTFVPHGFFFQPIVFSVGPPVTIRYQDPLRRQWQMVDDAVRRAAENPGGVFTPP